MSTGASTAINYAGLSADLDAGEFVEYESNEPHVVRASGPIYSNQILVSQGSDPNPPIGGDPSIIALPPIQQYQFEYLFYTPGTFENNFFHVMVPDGIVLTLDGTILDTIDCMDGSSAGSVNEVTYCCQVFDATEGVHELEGDKAFGMYVTGFNNFASYGYAGGLGLEPLASGCGSGGPYRLASCGSGSTSLAGRATCNDGSLPNTFWSTPDFPVRFEDVTSLTSTAIVDFDGSFTVCLDVLCGSTSTQCCSTILKVAQQGDGSSC
jgi:hypothetical protein